MDRESIDAELAAFFLRKLGRHLDCNINIIDRDGVIVASRDGARIGTFHESAFRLLETGADIEKVGIEGPHPSGVKPGVNLPIEHRGRIIGVVGITGDPREVSAIAYAVKTSVESMVELQSYKDRALQRLDKKNLFINYLLYDDEAPRAAVESLAAKLGYAPHVPRAPVLFRPEPSISAADALKAIKSCPLHRSADLSWTTPEEEVLVFKTIELADGGLIADYERSVAAYADSAESCLRSLVPAAPRPFRVYAGGIQTEFSRYRGAYRQVLWLADRSRGTEEKLVFFYRHLGEFLWSRLPRSELVDAFDALSSLLSADFAEELRSSVEALSEAGFNGKEAAARLGVHRNTLSARMARLEAVFGMDFRGDPQGREFLSLFSRYLDPPKT